MEAVIVAVYLMTSPHSNMLGLYYLPKLYLTHETGLSAEGASKGLAWCIEAGFCQYDGLTEMVWVMEMAAYQIAPILKPDDKRCKGVQKDYDALPNCPFLGAFFNRYKTCFHMTHARGLEGATEGATEAPSKQGEGTGEGEGAGNSVKGADAPDPIFGDGLSYLVRCGVPEKGARSFLGKMRKELADDLVAVELLVKAQQEEVSDPVPWLRAAAKRRISGGRTASGVAL